MAHAFIPEIHPPHFRVDFDNKWDAGKSTLVLTIGNCRKATKSDLIGILKGVGEEFGSRMKKGGEVRISEKDSLIEPLITVEYPVDSKQSASVVAHAVLVKLSKNGYLKEPEHKKMFKDLMLGNTLPRSR